MRKMSLKELNIGEESLLQREQLKSVFGGIVESSICVDGVEPEHIHWECADGNGSGHATVCPEHVYAYASMVDEFCGN